MIEAVPTAMIPEPMYAKCLKDHQDYDDTEPIFDPLTDIHKSGDFGKIFGMYADPDYWQPHHLYEVVDITNDLVQPGDHILHKYAGVLMVDRVTFDEHQQCDWFHFDNRDHTAHHATSKKIIASTDAMLGLPSISNDKVKQFIDASRTR